MTATGPAPAGTACSAQSSQLRQPLWPSHSHSTAPCCLPGPPRHSQLSAGSGGPAPAAGSSTRPWVSAGPRCPCVAGHHNGASAGRVAPGGGCSSSRDQVGAEGVCLGQCGWRWGRLVGYMHALHVCAGLEGRRRGEHTAALEQCQHGGRRRLRVALDDALDGGKAPGNKA